MSADADELVSLERRSHLARLGAIATLASCNLAEAVDARSGGLTVELNRVLDRLAGLNLRVGKEEDAPGTEVPRLSDGGEGICPGPHYADRQPHFESLESTMFWHGL